MDENQELSNSEKRKKRAFLNSKYRVGKKSSINKTEKRVQSIKNYFPSPELQEVFRSVMKITELKEDEIDEVRKVYYSYYKFAKETIEKGNIIIVDLFKIGIITPTDTLIIYKLNSLSKGYSMSNKKEEEVVEEFYKMLRVFRKLLKLKNNILNKKGFKNEEFKGSVYGHYQNWIANFKARGINIKTFEDWEGNGCGQGFFV